MSALCHSYLCGRNTAEWLIKVEQLRIRYASMADYNGVEKIMKQVQELHINLRPDIYQPIDIVLPYEEFCKAVEQRTLIVADQNEDVVGVLSYVHRHIESDKQVTRDVMFIDCVAVVERLRGRGIGRKLFEFAQNILHKESFDGLELQVNAQNQNARRFYENYGFKEKSINLELCFY